MSDRKELLTSGLSTHLSVTPANGTPLPGGPRSSGPFKTQSNGSGSGIRPVRQSGPQPVLTSKSGIQPTPESRDFRPVPTQRSMANVLLSRTPLYNPAIKPPSSISKKSTQKIGWRCQCCQATLPPESFVKNEAIMRDGLPLCRRCLQGNRWRRIKKVAYIAATVFFVAATGTCVFMLQRGSTPQALEARALKDAQNTLQIAQSANYSDSDRRDRVAVASVDSGASIKPEVTALARNAEETLKKRLKAEYGALSPKRKRC